MARISTRESLTGLSALTCVPLFERRSIFAITASSNPQHGPLGKGTVGMIKENSKLIHYIGYPRYNQHYVLYNLVNDPEEMEDLYQTKEQLAAELTTELNEKRCPV